MSKKSASTPETTEGHESTDPTSRLGAEGSGFPPFHIHQLLKSSPLLAELDAQCGPFLERAYARHVKVFDVLLKNLAEIGPVEQIGRDEIIRGEVDVYSDYIDSHIETRKYFLNFPESEVDLKLFINDFKSKHDNISDVRYLIKDYTSIVGDEYREQINTLYGLYLSITGKKSDSGVDALSLEERVAQLNAYILRHPGQEITLGFLSTLFPELHASPPTQSVEGDRLPLPTEAPEIYQGLRGSETPPEFVKRVYAPWLGQGLDRAHVKHLDPKLYTAIDNWSRKPGNEWPGDVDLPTRGEQNRRVVDQLREQAPDGDLTKVVGEFTLREAQRIRMAARRADQIRK